MSARFVSCFAFDEQIISFNRCAVNRCDVEKTRGQEYKSQNYQLRFIRTHTPWLFARVGQVGGREAESTDSQGLYISKDRRAAELWLHGFAIAG